MKPQQLFTLSILIFSFFLVNSGCKQSSSDLSAEIQKNEQVIFAPSATTFNTEEAGKLIKLYDQYIAEFPKDSLASEYLYKSANIQMNAVNAEDALNRFQKLIKEYPESKRASTSQFFLGFIYENNMKDLQKAKEAYLNFIEKYPSHELVKDAQMSIQNLGKSPEQIIKEFEEMQRQDSVRMADSVKKVRGKEGKRVKG